MSVDRFVELVSGFHRGNVRFVVIGVWGVNYWAFHGGQTFTTLDRDLFLPRDADNERRAWETCLSLGLQLWCGDEPLGDPKDRLLAERIVEHRILVTATSSDLVVDLSLTVASFDFERVWNEHRLFRVHGVDIPVARLMYIVESKRIANRPKDRLFLETHAEACANSSHRKKPKVTSDGAGDFAGRMFGLAGPAGIEPATSGVSGHRLARRPRCML